MPGIVGKCVVIGIGATILMDLWAILLNRVFRVPLANWAMVGRWFADLPSGKVFHDDMTAVAPFPNELALGWFAHYAIGVLYAGILVAVAGPGWLAYPTFLPAWILGLVTVGAGWFLLQPGMGAGWAASKRANAMQIRMLNIVAHTMFAIGLYGTARLIA